MLDAVLDLMLGQHRDLLKRGAVLVDERDSGQTPRVLFYLEHAIQDAGWTRAGDRRIVSKQMLYVEIDAAGNTRHLHYAPYLDYRPLAQDEPSVEAILERSECAWINRESRVPSTGRLRFIEVKGRSSGSATVTVTKNEILYSLNKPDDFILAMVEFLDGGSHRVRYLRHPFQREPDFGVTSVNYDFAELLARAEAPA